MSKAIEGVVLIGVAVGLAAGAAIFDPALLFNPAYDHLIEAVFAAGVSMEAAAAADALLQNRGENITTRQPAAFRQIIYGEQRVGGIMIYVSTTGSHHDQYNHIIVICGHEVDSIVNVYLDGRQIYWLGSGGGWVVRNGVGVGGVADGSDHTGPDGQKYNFGGTGHSGIYFEPRFGDQLPGDVIGGMTANDPHWAASSSGSPYVGGCCYGYLKIEYNQSLFPQLPEIKFTVRGKNDIYDPRTGTKGWTNNWALIIADIITNSEFGLGDDSVNEDQLIAAANVCDELVNLANGSQEARYTCNWHTDTATSPGDMLQTLMSCAAGRLCRIGGEWYIFPAYWQGSSFSFDETILAGPIDWTPTRSLRELWNRVTGTYTAPNYPYNVAGNLYDSNGWYNDSRSNNWPFAFQPTNYPQYACDPVHGYTGDAFLYEDSGVQSAWASGNTYAKDTVVSYTNVVDGVSFASVWKSLVDGNVGNTPSEGAFWTNAAVLLPKEIAQPACLSIAQAQRVAKIMLLRNRQQGSGTLPMQLEAWQMQPCTVFTQSFPAPLNWSSKTLEVVKVNFSVDKDQGGVPAVRSQFDVQETDSSVYEWSTSEELSVYDVPNSPSLGPGWSVDPPTGLTLSSDAATALTGADGVIQPRILAQWTPAGSATAVSQQIQFQDEASPGWLDAGNVDAVTTDFYIAGVVAGHTYDVRVRTINEKGGGSTWDEVDGCLVAAPNSLQSSYSMTPPFALTQTSSTALALAACTVSFGGLAAVNYAARTFTIPAPSSPTWYYVTIADPTQQGESGATLTPSCSTSTSLVGVQGHTYLGAIQATPSGTGAINLAGGWPAPTTAVNLG